jgi:tetratricopeptide (TPR) repeat protein
VAEDPGDLKIREDEYASNDEVRTAEEGKVSDIHDEIKKLAETGPAGGTIGTMPKSVLTAAKVALTDLVETSSSKTEAKAHALNLLQRGSAKITEITSAFNSISTSITTERKQDTDAVDAQKKVVKAANLVYEKSEGARVAKLDAKDEADHRVVIAKNVVKHEQDEYKKAQEIRDADIATINKAMKYIDELIAVEAKHAAGPTQNLLQVPAESKAAIKKVRDMIAAMKADVVQEEKFQKMILDMMKKKYDDALAAWEKAKAAYEQAVAEYKIAHDKGISEFGKYNNAESALSTEMAVAEQERRTINAVREMLTKLQSAEADVLGSCPLDKIGAVCGGYGECLTNKTDPMRTKYCKCKAGSGRTGRDCSFCKFGWKMATGTLKGFCQQVYTPTVSFLQTTAGQTYTVEDLNNAVETMMQTGRHTETSAGIEALLAALEKKLALKEKTMREERDNAKRRHEDSEKAAVAAQKLKNETFAAMNKAKVEMDKAHKNYIAIYTMYWFEHPLRNQETALLNKLDDIMIKLEGGTPPPRAEAVTQAALKASNTHTPTTTPSFAPTAAPTAAAV